MLSLVVVVGRVQVSAEESGVASEIVQKLIDAERDRVKLVSWSLFHPEALDMHPLESDISERTQVLEVRTTTWSRRRDAMRSLLCPTHGTGRSSDAPPSCRPNSASSPRSRSCVGGWCDGATATTVRPPPFAA